MREIKNCQYVINKEDKIDCIGYSTDVYVDSISIDPNDTAYTNIEYYKNDLDKKESYNLTLYIPKGKDGVSHNENLKGDDGRTIEWIDKKVKYSYHELYGNEDSLVLRPINIGKPRKFIVDYNTNIKGFVNIENGAVFKKDTVVNGDIYINNSNNISINGTGITEFLSNGEISLPYKEDENHYHRIYADKGNDNELIISPTDKQYNNINEEDNSIKFYYTQMTYSIGSKDENYIKFTPSEGKYVEFGKIMINDTEHTYESKTSILKKYPIKPYEYKVEANSFIEAAPDAYHGVRYISDDENGNCPIHILDFSFQGDTIRYDNTDYVKISDEYSFAVKNDNTKKIDISFDISKNIFYDFSLGYYACGLPLIRCHLNFYLVAEKGNGNIIRLMNILNFYDNGDYWKGDYSEYDTDIIKNEKNFNGNINYENSRNFIINGNFNKGETFKIYVVSEVADSDNPNIAIYNDSIGYISNNGKNGTLFFIDEGGTYPYLNMTFGVIKLLSITETFTTSSTGGTKTKVVLKGLPTNSDTLGINSVYIGPERKLMIKK